MPKIDLSRSPGEPDYFSPHVEVERRFYAGRGTGRPGLHVVAAGVETVTADYSIDRKAFPHFGIEFVAGGEGTLKLAGKPYRLQAGIAFCYGPRTAHSIATDPDNRLLKYFADFEGTDAQKLTTAAGFAAGQVLQSAQPSAVMSIFDELIRTGEKPQRFSGQVCRHLLSALVYRIAESAVTPESYRSPAFSTYAGIRRDLEENALNIQSLGDLAERNRIDEAYLCRLFGRFDFESPYRKLQRLKMQHAARELQQGGKLIKQIAAELGFSDPFHFSRTFKRVLSVAPSQLLQNKP